MLIAGTLAPAQLVAHQGHEHSNVIANADGDNVRLRTGPSYDDDEITRFPEGTEVGIVDGPYDANDESIWYQVEIEGQTGYMDSDFLVAIEVEETDENDGSDPEPTTGTAVTNDSVFLRTGPSTADDVVRTLSAGETVTLTGANRDGWNSVSATGGDGWVFAEYLSFGADPGGTRYTLATIHLRSGPDTSFDSLGYLDPGLELTLTGGQEGAYVEVESSTGHGWVAAEYIGPTAPEQRVEPEAESSDPELEPSGETGETGTRYTLGSVNLRSGPGTSFDSITSLDVGVQLELTGPRQYGFAEVTSSSGNGWVAAEFIGATAPEASPKPEQPATSAEPIARFATANVNLRTASSQASTVVTVIPTGTEVEFTGVTEEEFSEVRTGSGAGWIASEYLSETRPAAAAGPEPEASNSLIEWPVSGDEWVISQGYNGSSHQNQSQYWQYFYSFDLKRTDGSTTGQPVYSAVNGRVRWIDEATGGMSIYMGDGLAYAFFHARLDPGISEGDTITQGQYMGTIAPAGEAGSGSSAHLHITIWETSDEGNWSRRAIPFTGNVAIEGVEFPTTGDGNDYLGYTFNP